MVEENKTKKYSMEGYDFSEALYRNKDSVKGIVAILVGLNFMIHIDWKTTTLSIAAGICTLAAKLLADAVDYYFKEV